MPDNFAGIWFLFFISTFYSALSIKEKSKSNNKTDLFIKELKN